MSEPLIPLSAVMPEAEIPGTVTLADAHRLGADLLLYGNAFVVPTGREAPTHQRVAPTDVRLSRSPRPGRPS